MSKDSVRVQSEKHDTWSILHSLHRRRGKNHLRKDKENVFVEWFANWNFYNFAGHVTNSVAGFVAVAMDVTVNFVVSGVCWSVFVAFAVDPEPFFVFVLLNVAGLTACFVLNGTLAVELKIVTFVVVDYCFDFAHFATVEVVFVMHVVPSFELLPSGNLLLSVSYF